MARIDKRRVATALARYTVNPVVKGMIAVGLTPPGVVLLETTGRRTGSARRTPVGARRDGNSLWLVAEHGRRARVRAQHRGRSTGAGEDRPPLASGQRNGARRRRLAARRLREIGRGRPDLKLNSGVVRVMKSEPVTVRLDLD